MGKLIKYAAALAAVGLLGVATSARATFTTIGDYSASGTGNNGVLLSARVLFEYDSANAELRVTLWNTASSDVLAPEDVLTAVFFDIDPNTTTLTRKSAVLNAGSVVLWGPDGGGNVGGEWAYKANLSGAPANAALGLSSIGTGLFGPGDLFDPDANLAGPESPDGLQYGLLSAGDDIASGNAAVTGGFPLIKNSVVFLLGVQGTINSIPPGSVSFQYGTDLNEPNITVPEPTTMIAGALLLLPFAASTVRYVRRNRKA